MVLYSLFIALFEAYSAFIREAITGALDGLRSSPLSGWLLVLSKTLTSTTYMITQMLLFAVIARAFTFNARIAWAPLIAWITVVALFLAAVSGFVSASLAYSEARTGSVALLVLVLSIPYLKTAVDPLTDLLAGVAPEPRVLASLTLASLGFTGFAIALGGVVLE